MLDRRAAWQQPLRTARRGREEPSRRQSVQAAEPLALRGRQPFRFWSGPPPLADRACCCPARPVVRVLIPPAPARPHPADLLLCGHHYLASRAALADAGAVVIDETGAIVEPATYSGEASQAVMSVPPMARR